MGPVTDTSQLPGNQLAVLGEWLAAGGRGGRAREAAGPSHGYSAALPVLSLGAGGAVTPGLT